MSYFPSLVVAGETVSFAHLEPMSLLVPTETKPAGVRIDVVFSNHCFSESFDPALHTGTVVDVWDGQVRRIFERVRYDLSLGLPAIVRGLPDAQVFLTPEANYVRIILPAPAGAPGADYRMFFRLKREASATADLKLRVESAYSPTAGQALAAARMTKIRFKVLVDKTLRGERIGFHYKR